MKTAPKILAIIPARKGSKGLPAKNIKDLMGKPLIVWTLEQAMACKYITEIFVSTDCPVTAEICRRHGQAVTSLRPEHLARDDSSTIDVVDHIIGDFEKRGMVFDFILLLEPTSPLRARDDLDRAVELMLANPGRDGVVSLGQVALEHPTIIKKVDDTGAIVPYVRSDLKAGRRQELDKAYFPYGVLYLIKNQVFREKKSFYTDNLTPFFLKRWQNYEIDDICDFVCVEAILKAEASGVL